MISRLETARIVIALLACASGALAATMKQDADVFAGRDKKIGTLHEGAPVVVVEESGEWSKVRFETIDAVFEGYVKSDALDKTVAAPMPGESASPTDMPASVAAVDSPPAPAMTNAVAEPAARPAARRGGPEIALGTHWQMQSKSGGTLAVDFATFLKNVAKPGVNLVADKNYILYKELYYLMPVADALKKFGQTAVSAEAVNTPGFPVDSFKAYGFDPKIENVTRLTLVADMKGQLVAVQVSDSGLKALWLYRRFEEQEGAIYYSENLKLYDIVSGRTKGSSNWRVGAIVQQHEGVVNIDTELITGNPKIDEVVRSKERTRLYLPQPVADLCAHLLQSRK